jgi:hypothetical protein
MTAMAWGLFVILGIFYAFCLFTVCVLTFQKGYAVLGAVGFFLPLLWLIGAALPAKRRSRYAVKHALEYLYQVYADERRARTLGEWPTPRLRWEYPGSTWGYPESRWGYPGSKWEHPGPSRK